MLHSPLHDVLIINVNILKNHYISSPFNNNCASIESRVSRLWMVRAETSINCNTVIYIINNNVYIKKSLCIHCLPIIFPWQDIHLIQSRLNCQSWKTEKLSLNHIAMSAVDEIAGLSWVPRFKYAMSCTQVALLKFEPFSERLNSWKFWKTWMCTYIAKKTQPNLATYSDITKVQTTRR